MNRADFKKIAKIRLNDAKTLFLKGNYDGAYYLAGYVVECALKACIAKKTKKYDFPDKRTVEDSYVHDIERLVGVAGLDLQLKVQLKNPTFAINWTLVKDWKETSRYETQTSLKARDLLSAITDGKNGVFKWIKQYW
jgi:HEPN domain-containing protein